MNSIADVPERSARGVEDVWLVSLERPGHLAEWDPATLGPPVARELRSTRRPTSGDLSRHIPRRAFAVTTGSTLELESGLEHDLVKWLDLQREVVWLVAQPVRFWFRGLAGKKAVRHTPDLLSQNTDGAVTVWDARPALRREELFEAKAAATRDAFARIGWSYEVFEGFTTAMRMNVLWLSGYRRPAPWHTTRTDQLHQLMASSPLTVRDVIQHAHSQGDTTGELLSAMWHLIAIGGITCDWTRPIRLDTVLSWLATTGTSRAQIVDPNGARDTTTSTNVRDKLAVATATDIGAEARAPSDWRA